MTEVCSILVYGSEWWLLTEIVCKMLNGANTKMLSKITDKSYHEDGHEDTKEYTRSFEMVIMVIKGYGVKVGGTYSSDRGKYRLYRNALRTIYANM